MNTRAADADEDADVPGCPSRVLVALAVSACLVGLQLNQLLERGLVLRRAVDGSSRHDVCYVSLWCKGWTGDVSKNGSGIHEVRKRGRSIRVALGLWALSLHFAE